jgi:hypothetical protein
MDYARLDAIVYYAQALQSRLDDATNFREADHPRDNDGKFSSTGGASSGPKSAALVPAQSKDGKREAIGGGALPEHIQKTPLDVVEMLGFDPKGADYPG